MADTFAEPLTDTEIGSYYLHAVSKQNGLSPRSSELLIQSHELMRQLAADAERWRKCLELVNSGRLVRTVSKWSVLDVGSRRGTAYPSLADAIDAAMAKDGENNGQ